MTFAVLGDGRSGVELAATLADLLPDWYAQISGNKQEIRVVILQRGKEILKGDRDKLRSSANRALQQHVVPVELLLEAEISAVHPQRVEYKHGDRTLELPVATILWTIGTAVNPLIKLFNK